MKTFTIGTNDANQRFDKYLKKRKKSDREGDAAKRRAGSGVFQ